MEIFIAFTLSIGAMIILQNSPSYGERYPLGLVFGWLLVTGSWVILFSERNTFSILGVARGILVILGLLVSLIAVIIGTYIAERSSGLRDESEPLSNEEGILVRTILERRLRGD